MVGKKVIASLVKIFTVCALPVNVTFFVVVVFLVVYFFFCCFITLTPQFNIKTIEEN